MKTENDIGSDTENRIEKKDTINIASRMKVIKLLEENARLYEENCELIKKVNRYRLKEIKEDLDNLNLKIDEVNVSLKKFKKDNEYLRFKFDISI